MQQQAITKRAISWFATTLLVFLADLVVHSQYCSAVETGEQVSTPSNQDVHHVFCRDSLRSLKVPFATNVETLCARVETLPDCKSEMDLPIFHFDKLADSQAKRVLVFSLVHGDEPESGVVAALWIERLLRIDPRSSWRIIPIMNPDGYKNSTRLNSRGVDLNRNFPTNDWTKLAHEDWSTRRNRDPRRYPGPAPASESETRCALQHIQDFKPDLVVAIHTPYGVLDFDGPKDFRFPQFSLPWVSLGNFPGSLGRHMWVDHGVPVLTIELKGKASLKQLAELDRLQDISGTIALQTAPH